MKDLKESFEFNIGYGIPDYISKNEALYMQLHVEGTPVYVHKNTKKIGAFVKHAVLLEHALLLHIELFDKELEQAFRTHNMRYVASNFYFVEPHEYLLSGVQ